VKVVKHDIWKPTQEELLEEALQTEELNLKSLGMCKIYSTIFFIWILFLEENINKIKNKIK